MTPLGAVFLGLSGISGAFEVHCDMTTDGGGWTYVARGSSSSSHTNSSFGSVQTDPLAASKWHLSSATIESLVEYSLQYESYTTMGLNGDSSMSDYGQYRVRQENEFLTFTSAMFNYSSWDGSTWVAATTTGDSSQRALAWI